MLGKVSAHRLGQLLFFHKLDQADLRRLVAVFARLVLCCVITHGPACNTVAGRTSPFESKSCVMPTFLPKIPVTLAISFSIPSVARRFTSATAIGWELSIF